MGLANFEKKRLKQINAIDKQINEGLGQNLIAWLYKKTSLQKHINKVANDLDELPDLKATIDNLEALGDGIEDLIQRTNQAYEETSANLQSALAAPGSTQEFRKLRDKWVRIEKERQAFRKLHKLHNK